MKVANRASSATPDRSRSNGWAPTIDHVWAAVALTLPLIVGFAATLFAVDLAYHIRAGETILAMRALPHVDTYTFTFPGRAWVDQQWGAQIVLALAHRGGWPTVVLLRALLLFATFSCVWLAARKRGASVRTASLLTIGALFLSLTNLSMRPQAFAAAFFALTLLIIVDRDHYPRRLWLIPIITVVWANVHGSFVLAPLLIGLAWIEDRQAHAPTVTITLRAAIAALLGTFVTPFGIGAWRYAIAIGTNPIIRNSITEWRPTSVTTLSGFSFLASGVAITWYFARRKDVVKSIDLLWLGIFFAVGLSALRNNIWWALVAPVVIAGIIIPRQRQGHDARDSSVVNMVVLVALFASCVVTLPWLRDGVSSNGTPSLLTWAPQGIVNAAAAETPPGARLFVWQAWGSWFELALPSDPVFVDSRIEIIPARVWSDYENVVNGRDGWQEILDRWKVDAVALPTKGTDLLPLIARDPGWTLAYHDKDGTLFKRVDALGAQA